MQLSPEKLYIKNVAQREAIKKTLLVQGKYLSKLQSRLSLAKWLSIGLIILVIVLLIAVLITYYMLPQNDDNPIEIGQLRDLIREKKKEQELKMKASISQPSNIIQFKKGDLNEPLFDIIEKESVISNEENFTKDIIFSTKESSDESIKKDETIGCDLKNENFLNKKYKINKFKSIGDLSTHEMTLEKLSSSNGNDKIDSILNIGRLGLLSKLSPTLSQVE